MAKHFTYSAFLDKTQGLHSWMCSEPERPVTKVTLTPHDWGWGLPGGVSAGTHLGTQTRPVLPPALAGAWRPSLSGLREEAGWGEGRGNVGAGVKVGAHSTLHKLSSRGKP